MVKVICSGPRPLWWDSYKGVDRALTLDESKCTASWQT